ncbi:TRAP transporter large permease [Microbaculum marinum]|uniref:TRAP transporter large permease protein n=1 Tax=Microbaculum marinum TaxID=1764581 RepID=A0AAW9RPY3_9HYPH
MAWLEWFLMLMVPLLVAMALGLPVAFAFIAVNVIGAAALLGFGVGVGQLVSNMTAGVTTYALAPVPLFLLMGSLFFHSGLARRVLDAVDMMIGRVPARLSYVTVATGTLFAALSGSSLANTGMLGTLMVPEMRRRGYKNHMALGPILGSGGLAVIIPPSALAVLLGSLAQIDIGALLLAGLVPGVILAVLYAGVIYVQSRIDPSAAPYYVPEDVPLARRIVVVLREVAPMSIIVAAVVGTILTGTATPTEAAALGTLAVLILAIAYRALSWDSIRKSLDDTTRVTGMTFLLITASSTYSQLLAFSGASSGLVRWATGFDVGALGILLLMLLVLLVLGMLMDQVSMMLITLPVFLPLAMTYGFDPIWFGLLMLLMLEVSFTTPPFGLLLFVMQGVAPPGTSLGTIARAATPYIGCVFLLIALLIAFPQVSEVFR